MKPIRLKINEPCHQSWDAMKSSGAGRFCSNCQKTVNDFSTMTDSEIVAFITTQKGITCGRVHISQHDRELYSVRKNKSNLWLKAAALFTGIFISQQARSQTSIEINTSTISVPIPIGEKQKPERESKNEIADTTFITIKGRVIDGRNDEPVPFAKGYLLFQGDSLNTNRQSRIFKTNKTGYFDFRIKRDDIKKSPIIEVYGKDSVGAEIIGKNDADHELIIKIYSHYFMGRY